jgi:hypothetical protein
MSLRADAEKAALATLFEPVRANGRSLSMRATLVYTYTGDTVEAAITGARAVSPTADDQLRLAVAEKLHHWLTDVVDRTATGSKPSANEALFVHDGKASIQVQLTVATPAVLRRLRDAGLTIDARQMRGTKVIGRIAVQDITPLTRFREVKMILPRI